MTERKKSTKKKKRNSQTNKSYGETMNELLTDRKKTKHVVVKKRKR